jgi:hypothetical protein
MPIIALPFLHRFETTSWSAKVSGRVADDLEYVEVPEVDAIEFTACGRYMRRSCYQPNFWRWNLSRRVGTIGRSA